MFRLKYKGLLVIFLTLLLLIIIMIMMNWRLKFEEPIIIKTAIEEQLVYNCCVDLDRSLRHNIFFLKTHKTGSSTVQNVLFRFGDKRNLTFLLPMYYTYYSPLTNSSLAYGTQTPDHKYNILASHMRYSSNLKNYMYPDCITVTILRNPATLFQSLYSFFQLHSTLGLNFRQFLSLKFKPINVWTIDSVLAYRGYNQMSVDLGFNPLFFANQAIIDQFIKQIDEEFDFVMIMEYFDASMVLLANVMGWPLEYVSYLVANARPNNSYSYILTEEDKIELLNLNNVDSLLYSHFLEKFRKCMVQYGIERLNNDVKKLQALNRDFKQRCVAKENMHGLYGTINYDLKNKSDWDCVHAAKMQIPYGEDLYRKQNDMMKKKKSKN